MSRRLDARWVSRAGRQGSLGQCLRRGPQARTAARTRLWPPNGVDRPATEAVTEAGRWSGRGACGGRRARGDRWCRLRARSGTNDSNFHKQLSGQHFTYERHNRTFCCLFSHVMAHGMHASVSAYPARPATPPPGRPPPRRDVGKVSNSPGAPRRAGKRCARVAADTPSAQAPRAPRAAGKCAGARYIEAPAQVGCVRDQRRVGRARKEVANRVRVGACVSVHPL